MYNVRRPLILSIEVFVELSLLLPYVVWPSTAARAKRTLLLASRGREAPECYESNLLLMYLERFGFCKMI